MLMLFAPVSNQYSLALRALCFPVDFSLTALPPSIIGCFSPPLGGGEQPGGCAGWMVDRGLNQCFHSIPALPAGTNVRELFWLFFLVCVLF